MYLLVFAWQTIEAFRVVLIPCSKIHPFLSSLCVFFGISSSETRFYQGPVGCCKCLLPPADGAGVLVLRNPLTCQWSLLMCHLSYFIIKDSLPQQGLVGCQNCLLPPADGAGVAAKSTHLSVVGCPRSSSAAPPTQVTIIPHIFVCSEDDTQILWLLSGPWLS